MTKIHFFGFEKLDARNKELLIKKKKHFKYLKKLFVVFKKF